MITPTTAILLLFLESITAHGNRPRRPSIAANVNFCAPDCNFTLSLTLT